MIRVVHVTPYFAPAHVYGGPPRSIHGLCRALRDAGADARVITTTANGAGELEPAPQGTAYDGIPVRYCRRTFPRFVWNAERLRTVLAEEVANADILHVHALWHAPGWLAARIAADAGIPYVVSPRGMLQPSALARHRWRKRVAFALIERGDLARAALLHATSDEEAETLRRAGSGSRVTIVPNGVNAPVPGQRVPPKTATVMFLGRIHPIKRLDLLAAAMGRLRIPARLVVAGPDEREHRSAVAPLFERARVPVVWAGEVDDATRLSLFAEASALVLCSDSESFGMSVVEAMAAGVPVVATRTCPWRELETEGAGYWVDQEAGAIADAIDRILADPFAALEMGRRGKALVTRRYTWKAVANAMIAEYLAVLGSAAAA